MWILIIGLIVLTAIAMAVGYARNKKIQKKIESGELQGCARNSGSGCRMLRTT